MWEHKIVRYRALKGFTGTDGFVSFPSVMFYEINRIGMAAFLLPLKHALASTLSAGVHLANIYLPLQEDFGAENVV